MSSAFRNILLLAAAVSVGCAAGSTECESRECFAEALATCEPASYTTEQAAGAEGRYAILTSEEDGCRVEFRYTRNPNPDLVDGTMTFVIASADQLQEAVAGCLTGDADRYDCRGSLPELSGSVTAAAPAGPLPCGEAVEVAGEPPVPMPGQGLWGFVGRDGEWVIEPRWEQVEEFHEGRAAVAEQGRWGIIDRQGEYVLEPGLRSQSYSTVDGARVGASPLSPFSEGCAAAVRDVASKPPFFVDRDGGLHWRDTLPASLAEYDVREFGSFSEGRAWFRAYEQGLDDAHGWIDAAGEVVIAPEYAGAGDFVDGLAPAATGADSWGFIDDTGELALPGKWTLGSAGSFSEGRALVDVGTYDWAYMGPEGIAFERVRFADSRGAVDFEMSGAFHDGLAPVLADLPDGDLLVYADADGAVAFVPDEIEGLKVCNAGMRPEFHGGLVRLLVADDGDDCGPGAHDAGLAAYENAHYVYVNTAGEVVLRQDEARA